MSKWPKKPLLAVLAALTAVGLGVPCAMADGTAAATAYISVEAAGGTTLDGRTYKAYRLGSYGKTDVRVDQDSGDRYAASIPVSTDPDRADAVADAGAKAGFTGDDMLPPHGRRPTPRSWRRSPAGWPRRCPTPNPPHPSRGRAAWDRSRPACIWYPAPTDRRA